MLISATIIPMKAITKSGFTIIELLVVITIIGILSTVGIVSFANIQSSTRDSQRSSKITIIANALEKYYSQHGEYPSCAAMSQPASTVVSTTLVGVDPSNLTTPSSTGGTNSFAALATCDPSVINNLSSDVFAYVGNNSTPCLTTSGQTAACLEYTLKYREESTGNTISIVSRHTIPTLAMPTAPTTTVTLNGSNVLATVTPVSCPVGSLTQYGIRNRTNGGSWSSYTPWDTITNAIQAANQVVKYEYQSEARCYPDGTATSASNPAVGAVSNAYINPITTVPTTPVVAANTVGSTTTWSWPASTGCASGTVVNYRYDYTYGPSPSYDSGWVTPGDPTALSISFTTTTQALTYAVSVQAKCTNANTSSGWSASGNASYYRPSYGNAVASDLLSGKTATVLAGSITGTMTNMSSYNSSVSSAVASGTLYTRISPGAYLTPTGIGYPEITTGVPDLVSGNILSGKNILGVAGGITNYSGGVHILSQQNTVCDCDGEGYNSVYAQPPAGYYDGASWIRTREANLVAGNIKSGVSILGTVGTFVGGGAPGSQSYTTAGTYSFTVPAGVTRITPIITGGGGAGGWNDSGYSTHNYWAGGGGGGGTYIGLASVTPGQVVTVVVGAGGLPLGAMGIANPGGASSVLGMVGGGGGGGGNTYTDPGGREVAPAYGGTGGGYGGSGGNGSTGGSAYGGSGLGGYGNGGTGSTYSPSCTAGASGRVVINW